MKPSEYSTEIGQRIQAARKAKDLSLGELAALTKRLPTRLSKSRIGNYEQGTRMPGPEEINTLGMVLEVAPAYLMCLSLAWDKHQLDFMRNWMILPENERERYFARIEALSLAYRKSVPDETPTPQKATAPQQIPAKKAERIKRLPARQPR